MRREGACPGAAPPPRRRGGLAALVLLAAAASACSRPAEGPAAAEPPLPRRTRGYVLVSLDTLRADHLGTYGYGRATSPFLDSLAARGTLFEEAYSHYPSTLVSHMSMLTGLLPGEHGVVEPGAVLAPEIETLAQVFQRGGFATAAYTEGGYMSGRYGFRRGFETFHARHRSGSRQVQQTFRRGVAFLEAQAPDRPFLLFLHTYAVHAPYDAPERYQRMFWQGDPPPGAPPPTPRALTEQNLRGDPLPPRAVEYLTAAYDAGIRETDDVLRAFFADLERLGLRDDVTLVITADHGEELQDHGRFHHTQLYRETMRVPLLVVHPDRREPVRQAGLVGLSDLAPTLYELARLTPRQAPSGRSLARLLGPTRSPPDAASLWAEAGNGHRALYRQEGGRIRSLLLSDPPAEGWMGRRLVFDAAGGELRFGARAYRVPRSVRVWAGRAELPPLALTPEWGPAVLRLPRGVTRVRLEADGCESPPDEPGAPEPRCLAFQLRGVRPARIELYDLADDPGQRRDLSTVEPRETRRLLREMAAFRPRPRAGPAAAPLDPELVESLRALGYVQ